MPNPVFEIITRAIDQHRLLVVVDEAGERMIEPYLVFESAAGDMLLHGWQRSGAFRRQPPPKWCNLHIEDLASVEITAEHFTQPQADYNPRSSHFHRVLYEVLPARSAAAVHAGARVKRARRAPPSKRGASGARSYRRD